MSLTVDMVLYDCGMKSGTSGATQSSADGLYCFDAGVNAGAVGAKKFVRNNIVRFRQISYLA